MSVMRNNIILGIVLSVCITIMVMLPRFAYGHGAAYLDLMTIRTFIMLLTIWFGHMWLLSCGIYKQLIPQVWLRNIISIIVVTFTVFYLLEIMSQIYPNEQRGAFFERFYDRVDRWGFIRVLVWNIIYNWILFSQVVLTQKKDAELKVSHAQKLALEAKIASFREQLSPHFMFNSLNTLSAMVKEDSAQRFVEQLASVYRYLLESREQNTVSLEKELQFVRSYWHILKERFDDAIDIEISISGDISKAKIPPLALQTLVENAVKHNVATQNRPLRVTICKEDDMIVVKNNLQQKSKPEHSTGVGLHNLTERYALLHGKKVEITCCNNFFTVKLPIL